MNCGYCGASMGEGRTLVELVDRDFRRARWRHRLRRLGQLVARLRGKTVPGHLACFAEGRGEETITGRRSLGIQTVELAKEPSNSLGDVAADDGRPGGEG